MTLRIGPESLLLVYAWVSHCGSSANHLLVWESGSSSHRGDVVVVTCRRFEAIQLWLECTATPSGDAYLQSRHLSSTTLLHSTSYYLHHFITLQCSTRPWSPAHEITLAGSNNKLPSWTSAYTRIANNEPIQAHPPPTHSAPSAF